MTKTAKEQIAAGLKAAQDDPTPPLSLALVITNPGDLQQGAQQTVTQRTEAFDKIAAGVEKEVEKEAFSIKCAFERIIDDTAEVESRTLQSVTQYRRQKYLEALDALREHVKATAGWCERAETTLRVISSEAAYLTSRHGMDSSAEFANLVARCSSFGFAAFQVAVAEAHSTKNRQLAAALVEVINTNRNKRIQMSAAGINPNSIAAGVVGDEYRVFRSSLEQVVHGAKTLQERHAGLVRFVNQSAPNPGTSSFDKIKAGLRAHRLTKLKETA